MTSIGTGVGFLYPEDTLVRFSVDRNGDMESWEACIQAVHGYRQDGLLDRSLLFNLLLCLFGSMICR